MPPTWMSLPAASLALALIGVGGGAGAGEPPVVALAAGGSACPAPEAVAAALVEAMPYARVMVLEAPAGAEAIAVDDLGARYRVRVAGVVRDSEDPGRRCAERARAAAVLIALELQPPSVGDPEPTRPPTPVMTPAPPPAFPPPLPPAPPPPSRVSARVELFLAGALAPREVRYNSPLTGGGGLRLALALPYVGIALGATALAPVRIDLSRGSAVFLRVPMHAGIFGWWRWSRVELSYELGAAVSWVRISGVSYELNATAAIIDVAVRTGVWLFVRATERLRPFVAVEAAFSPDPPDLIVSGMPVGTAPALWLGGLAGLALKIF